MSIDNRHIILKNRTKEKFIQKDEYDDDKTACRNDSYLYKKYTDIK